MLPIKISLTGLLLLTLVSLTPWPGAKTDLRPPHGRFAELHSCELFAGSCIVSSEANELNSYALRVWQFDGGNFHGADLRGLTVALLEEGDANLAVTDNQAGAAVVYLPPGLSAGQKSALLAWVQKQTSAKIDDFHIKITSQQVKIGPGNVQFYAGNDIAFTAAPALKCNVGGCGEMLWYQPRSASSSFAVDQLGVSRIVEPLLSPKWMDHGRRTLFVGRFGDGPTSSPQICGGTETASL
jgi:hypothetical protein